MLTKRKYFELDICDETFGSWGSQGIEVAAKTEVYDLLAAMLAGHGWISDKVEGLAVTIDGTVFAVIDNDGVDDAPGESQFLRLGMAADLFD